MRTTIICIACSLATAWAQQDSSTTPGSSSSSRQSGQFGKSSQYSSMHGQQQSLRVSQQIMNAQVKGQDGQQLGQISDLIANPQSGRIEFAVIEKGDKLCPIPFQLLSPEGTGSSSTSGTGTSSSTSSSTSRDTTPGASSTTPGASSSTSGRFGQTAQKVTFVARVDSQKIEQGPSFTRTQWPDISQPTWSQQVYSHYGVQPEAVGSPGSSSSGSFKSSSQGSASPGSSSTSGSSSSDSDSSSKSKSKSSQDKSSQSKSNN